MNLKVVIITLFLFSTVIFIGCYTKLGYYDPAYLKEKQQEQAGTNEEKIEETTVSDAETDGYYGRRKRTHRSSYSYRDDSYWVPYTPYPYAYYPHTYYPHPWYYGYGYYGYHAPYYRYYRGYYPYTGYYGWYGRRSYSNIYKRGAAPREYRSEYRRSRFSRSATSTRSQSNRTQQNSKNRNED